MCKQVWANYSFVFDFDSVSWLMTNVCQHVPKEGNSSSDVGVYITVALPSWLVSKPNLISFSMISSDFQGIDCRIEYALQET